MPDDDLSRPIGADRAAGDAEPREPGGDAPRALAARIAEQLSAAGIEDARGEAWLLLAAATGRARAALMAGSLERLSPAEQARLAELVRRRAAREPIAYILGEKEFWSLPFSVSPAVLIPRPETETVVEAVLDQVADRQARLQILDLGTGSGCLLLALLVELPNALGLGVDRSEEALRIAKRNAERLGLGDRARFAAGDWGCGLAGRYDVIVCNPPYVTESEWPALQPEVRAFEPAGALRAGSDGLDAYRALAPDLARLLSPVGVVCVEIGQGQADAVVELLAAHGLAVVERRRDLAGIERCLVARHDPADHSDR
jgi:release factor glutamine methyltransferase